MTPMIISRLTKERNFGIRNLIPVIFAYSFWFRSLNGLIVDLTALSGSQITETLQFRLQVWDWAINIFSNYPFTGVGYNIFRKLAPMLYFGSWLGDVAHAHNVWLDIGVTLGAGGVLIWIWIWFRNLYSLWKVCIQSPSLSLKYLSVGLIAGWYSYFVFGLADTIPLGSKLGLGIFFVLGFGQLAIQGSFQSGLSWRTILAKRDNFRKAFHNFDFNKVARFTERDVERLLKDEGIVRHRGKIEAVINNAKCAQELVKQQGSLASFFWRYEPKANALAAPQTVTTSDESVALSKALKKMGWKFVGPTTVYAFLQAMGLINDHVEDCMIRQKVEQARKKFKRP